MSVSALSLTHSRAVPVDFSRKSQVQIKEAVGGGISLFVGHDQWLAVVPGGPQKLGSCWESWLPLTCPRSVPFGVCWCRAGASLSPLGRQTAAFLTTSPELLGLEDGQCVI